MPTKWDLESDVVVVGGGGAGLASAITAHDHGVKALILEREPHVGGVMAYSFGEVWVPGNHYAAALGLSDSVEKGYLYVKKLSMGYGDDVAILNQATHAPAALRYFEEKIGLQLRVVKGLPDYYWPLIEEGSGEGRYLEALPFPASTLGEWQSKTGVSPHVPYGLTHVDIFGSGGPANILNWDFSVMGDRLAKDERCLGAGLVCYFVKGAIDRSIEMLVSTMVHELICDGTRVVGVRATKDGKELNVKATRGVVLATSGYDSNKELSKSLGQQLDLESMVAPSVDGSHIKLAGRLGARVARVPDVTMLGYQVPGEEHAGGAPLWRNALFELGLPHTIVVNRAGRRFADESFYRSVCYAIDFMDGATQTHPNFPCWVIFDSEARARYPFGPVMPGQELPRGFGIKAESMEDLAAKTGIAMEALAETVNSFNGYCASNADPDFNRGTRPWGAFMSGDAAHKPNANLGPVAKTPFYAIQLSRLSGGGIGSAGLVGDRHCRVLDWDENPITGLYVAGNAMARLDNGALMQSGVTNARAITHGFIIGQHVAGNPSNLLDKHIDAAEG